VCVCVCVFVCQVKSLLDIVITREVLARFEIEISSIQNITIICALLCPSCSLCVCSRAFVYIVYIHTCVCVCVCEREREREREYVFLCVCVCVCVCTSPPRGKTAARLPAAIASVDLK
jgi:hypothetical protein